jgi:transcriptional repressor NrdR
VSAEDRSPLKCPHCASPAGTEVVDSRGNVDGTAIRRRRQCLACQERFTTYEAIVDPFVFEQQHARAKAIARQLRTMAGALEVW